MNTYIYIGCSHKSNRKHIYPFSCCFYVNICSWNIRLFLSFWRMYFLVYFCFCWVWSIHPPPPPTTIPLPLSTPISFFCPPPLPLFLRPALKIYHHKVLSHPSEHIYIYIYRFSIFLQLTQQSISNFSAILLWNMR